MSTPIPGITSTAGAAALQGVHPVDLSSLKPVPQDAAARFYTIPPEKQQELVAKAFVGEVGQHPELLGFTPDEAARRFANVPNGALQGAVDQLVKQYDLKIADDAGNPLTLGQILQQVPQAVGTQKAKQVIGDWFKGLKPGQQALVVSLAAAATLGARGVQGLGQLGLGVDVAKLPNGKLSVALTTNERTGQGTEVKLSGNAGVNFGASGAIAGGSIDTSGAYLLQGALNLVFGDRAVNLGAARSSKDGTVYSIGYNGRNLTVAGQSTNGQLGGTVSYKVSPEVTVDAGLHAADPAPGADPNATANYIRAQYRRTF